MKIRIGFVSNSSSSSFVVGKAHMTPEQIKKFSKFLDNQRFDDGETYISESEYYFNGTLSYHDEHITEFLTAIGVDSKFIACKS